jgi:hypothetical protein
MTEIFIHPTTCAYFHSIEDGDMLLEEVSMSSINDWLQKSPSETPTLDDTSIEIPVYALRRRNAVVADLPNAPFYH